MTTVERPLVIKAPVRAKFLSDFMKEGLPKNVLFDKVTTGCGGTYLAITNPEPYIIAVPTKALVKDKVSNPEYLEHGLQGVSSDYPLKDRMFETCNKIIVTYKSLPVLAQRVDIRKYNLLVDEAHMLTNMAGYARKELKWILENFSNFASFCFMSATIPRSDHLLPEIASLRRAYVSWPRKSAVTFRCFYSSKAAESILQIIYEHHVGDRAGTPYFFYNSVKGIVEILKRIKSAREALGDLEAFRVNVVCSDTDYNRKSLKAVGQEIGSPNAEADIHFITATAFEGVDFYDTEGVTYIVSDKAYANTKYSIETTIPQIVGRLRDSKYNQEVTVLYNKHDKIIDMSPREFSIHLEQQESSAKYLIEHYEKFLQDEKSPGYEEVALGILSRICKNPFIEIEGQASDFEDLLVDFEVKEGVFPKVSFYPHARALIQQTYDLFHEERYILGDSPAASSYLSLGKLLGDARELSEEASDLFKVKKVGLKTICTLYEQSKDQCRQRYPDWFDVIETLSLDVCKSYQYNKRRIMALYKASEMKQSYSSQEAAIYKKFKIGQSYSSKYIKDTLTELGVEKAKGTYINRWFDTVRSQVNGREGYRIIRKL